MRFACVSADSARASQTLRLGQETAFFPLALFLTPVLYFFMRGFRLYQRKLTSRFDSPMLPPRPRLSRVCTKALVTSILTYNRRAAAAVFSAGASHQLRDATRRGLWLYPPRGPKTPPLRYPVYLLAQALLPLVVALYLRWDIGAGCAGFFRGDDLWSGVWMDQSYCVVGLKFWCCPPYVGCDLTIQKSAVRAS